MLIRKVLDSNFCANPAVGKYLEASHENYVVLCEYADIEALKSRNPVEGLANTLSVLKNFSKQVIVLKNTRAISIQKISKSGYIKRMISDVQTRGFDDYCRNVDDAANGNVVIKNEILRQATNAKKDAEEALEVAEKYVEAARAALKDFSKSELEQINNSEVLSKDLFTKVLNQLLEMAIHSHSVMGVDIHEAEPSDIVNTVAFRTLLCNYLMIFRWVANGSPPKKGEKIRNHVYDCGFAAYATLFDGLLSNDEGAQTTYRAAKRFLKQLPQVI